MESPPSFAKGFGRAMQNLKIKQKIHRLTTDSLVRRVVESNHIPFRESMRYQVRVAAVQRCSPISPQIGYIKKRQQKTTPVKRLLFVDSSEM
jgi:hypothetical protein